MREVIFVISVLGIIYCFIKIEIHFIHKSISAFKDLKKAIQDLERENKNLEQYIRHLKDKK